MVIRRIVSSLSFMLEGLNICVVTQKQTSVSLSHACAKENISLDILYEWNVHFVFHFFMIFCVRFCTFSTNHFISPDNRLFYSKQRLRYSRRAVFGGTRTFSCGLVREFSLVTWGQHFLASGGRTARLSPSPAGPSLLFGAWDVL